MEAPALLIFALLGLQCGVFAQGEYGRPPPYFAPSSPGTSKGVSNLVSAMVPSSHINAPTFPADFSVGIVTLSVGITSSVAFRTTGSQTTVLIPSASNAQSQSGIMESTGDGNLPQLTVTESKRVVPASAQSTFEFHPHATPISPSLDETTSVNPVITISASSLPASMLGPSLQPPSSQPPSSATVTGSGSGPDTGSQDTTTQPTFLPLGLGPVVPMCTQTVVVVDIVTVYVGPEDACARPPSQSSNIPSLGSMTVPTNTGTATTLRSESTELQSTLNGSITSNTGKLSVSPSPSKTATPLGLSGSGLATSSTISGSLVLSTPASVIQPSLLSYVPAGQVTESSGLARGTTSPTSYTLIALSSPERPIMSSVVEATVTTSSSAPVITSFTTSEEIVPSTTILTSLPQVSSHSHDTQSSTSLTKVTSTTPSAAPSIMSLTSTANVETSSSFASTPATSSQQQQQPSQGGSCTSVARGTKPSPAYTDPQSGLLYRIQCGTTQDLVQQCPYLCSEGGGGLFRQCQQNDESGTGGGSGAPIVCERCLPPCGASRRDVRKRMASHKPSRGDDLSPAIENGVESRSVSGMYFDGMPSSSTQEEISPELDEQKPSSAVQSLLELVSWIGFAPKKSWRPFVQDRTNKDSKREARVVTLKRAGATSVF